MGVVGEEEEVELGFTTMDGLGVLKAPVDEAWRRS